MFIAVKKFDFSVILGELVNLLKKTFSDESVLLGCVALTDDETCAESTALSQRKPIREEENAVLSLKT